MQGAIRIGYAEEDQGYAKYEEPRAVRVEKMVRTLVSLSPDGPPPSAPEGIHADERCRFFPAIIQISPLRVVLTACISIVPTQAVQAHNFLYRCHHPRHGSSVSAETARYPSREKPILLCSFRAYSQYTDKLFSTQDQ